MGDFLYICIMNYKQIHDSIIDRAKTRVLPKETYTERHHIIPRCMGGPDDKSNLVDLTAREHYVIHKLLTEIYPNHIGLHKAVWFMSLITLDGRKYKVSSHEYERHKNNLTYWDYELCKVAASKCISKIEFKTKYNAAYNNSRERGWLDDITTHMEELCKPKFYWTKEKCREVALKYTSQKEFQSKDNSCFNIARDNGWLKEITKHISNKKSKIVLDTYTGIFYESAKEVSRITNLTYLQVLYDLRKRKNGRYVY